MKWVIILIINLLLTINKSVYCEGYDIVIGLANGTGLGYENIGTTNSPTWTSNSNYNIPDVGTDNNPCFLDIDFDGDLDLLSGESSGECILYQNIGITNYPTWTKRDDWKIPDTEISASASPTFADLDSDGDFDILVGVLEGKCYAYKNIGTRTNPIWTRNNIWDIPDIGSRANPFLCDLDKDGDYDLLIGTSDGITYGYENTGNINSPNWIAKPSWNTPDVGADARPYGADLDNDGDIDLMIGEQLGNTNGIKNTGTQLAPIWSLNPSWDIADIGTSASPAIINFSEENYLAVSLLSLKVNYIEDGYNLEWTTLSEVNHHYFTIQKSFDFTNWIEIAKIYSFGNALTLNNYSYHDKMKLDKKTLYRLKFTDNDGNSVFSKIAIPQYNKIKRNDIVILSNNLINLNINKLNNPQINLYNTLGQNQFNNIGIQIMENSIDIDISELIPGIYYLNYEYNNIKFIKY